MNDLHDVQALAVTDDAGRRLADGKRTLRQVVDSPDYPLPADSGPDRLVRQLADLIPGWPTELSTPGTESSAIDIFLEVVDPSRPRYNLTITVDLPAPESKWWVSCSGDATVELSFAHEASPLELAAVIRVAQALEVLPRPD